MKIVTQADKTDLPIFMEQWLNDTAPELESYAKVVEKIKLYFTASAEEALSLEKEIASLYTKFYLELGKLKRLTFLVTLQGFRGVAEDFGVKNVGELDHKLAEIQAIIANKKQSKEAPLNNDAKRGKIYPLYKAIYPLYKAKSTTDTRLFRPELAPHYG